MSRIYHRIVLLLIILTISEISGDCRKTFVTYCDNLNDYLNYESGMWRQLIVGHLNYKPNEQWSLLHLYRFLIQDLTELEWLTINNQLHGKLEEQLIISICHKKLKNLHFYKNNLNNFYLYTLRDCPLLIELNVVNNNIKQIIRHSGNTAHIDTVDFSENKLTEIKENTFIGLVVRQLIIRSNQLSSIEANAFNESLEILNLDHNEFSYIPDDSLINLENLKVFTMSHNKISSIPNLNFLKKIEKFDFSYNKINSIRTRFQSYPNLKHIDLSHNLIKKINFVSLIPLNEFPKKISIAFNALTQFQLSAQEWRFNFTAPVTLILFGNPWNCRCLDEINEFLKDRPINRTACDLSLFGNGRFPSCIDKQNSCVTIGIAPDTAPQNSFFNVLAESQRYFTCNIDSDMLNLERPNRDYGILAFPLRAEYVGNQLIEVFGN